MFLLPGLPLMHLMLAGKRRFQKRSGKTESDPNTLGQTY